MTTKTKRRVADWLKHTARLLIKAANRLDRPTVTLYDGQWNKVGTINAYITAGFDPKSVVASSLASNLQLLEHTGLKRIEKP